MSFQIEKQSANTVKMNFSGRLDMDSVAKLWDDCLAAIQEQKPKHLILDLKAIDYCDAAGLALIQRLQKQQADNKGTFQVENLKADLQRLLTTEEGRQQVKIEPTSPAPQPLIEKIGHVTLNIIEDFRDNISFLGNLAYQIYFIFLNPNKFRWLDFWRAIEEVGPKALPIITLIGFLIGLISTFQAAPSFRQFGAQILMINLVALGLVREMGPLLTAVLLAGRTASAFAAEIGTMKINQEISALRTMGLSPIRFLVLPRILATMLITPLLEIFLIIFGLLGCFFVMRTLGYSWHAFIHQVHLSIAPMDYIGGLIKVFVFGWVIAGIGCLHGLKTSFDALAVGRSTTQAVVSSLIMLVIVDGIFAVVYYVLRI